jgi:HD-like signal output (HDOD) protein
MTTRRILFVDDDVSVLEGLQNLFHRQRKSWQTSFAVGAGMALDEMAKAPFDVIVSDMKMPGMDGPALLTQVRDRYPCTARIVLSGQADREAVLRALPVAHQFLGKPCDAAQLKTVIERTCSLQALLRDEAIVRVVGQLDRLPSSPDVYWALIKALGRSSTRLADIAEVVEQDPATSAKVLQLVNSAYFGLSQEVGSIRQAVLHLGADLLRALLLNARVFTVDDTPIPGWSIDDLRERSVLVGRVARRVVGRPDLGDEAFTAGLLLGIGQMVLARGIPERYAMCCRLATERGVSLAAAEREVFGVSHAEVGAYLVGLWGLPTPIVEAVAFHERPGSAPAGGAEVLAAAHVAHVVVMQALSAGVSEVDEAFLQSRGAIEMAAWRRFAEDEIARAS